MKGSSGVGLIPRNQILIVFGTKKNKPKLSPNVQFWVFSAGQTNYRFLFINENQNTVFRKTFTNFLLLFLMKKLTFTGFLGRFAGKLGSQIFIFSKKKNPFLCTFLSKHST